MTESISSNRLTLNIVNATQSWDSVASVLGNIVDATEHSGLQMIDKTLFDYRISEGDTLTVSYSPLHKMDRYTISHIRAVANKVAYCIGCNACTVQCPTGAFTIDSDRKIRIRTNLCVHCSNCLTFIEKGCVVAKSLTTTSGGMDMKGMNRYQTFGLRQEWLQHFFEYGTECFGSYVLGNRQYDSLKVWLREAGMLAADKTVDLTPLGKKLLTFNPFDPFTWAIIWANLAYNSIICKWYVLNTEIGGTYDKGALVDMIGENYARRTRENAIASVCDLLNKSPIGGSLKQGIPVPASATTYTYTRDGWDMPDGIAILYSLYLYAEHTGRYSFTLAQMAQARNHPDSKGVNPADIFGIEAKAFREILQGLALQLPEHIRVNFVADLDNIILMPEVSSLSILDLVQI